MSSTEGKENELGHDVPSAVPQQDSCRVAVTLGAGGFVLVNNGMLTWISTSELITVPGHLP